MWKWIERVTGLESVLRFMPNPVFRLELKNIKELQPDPRARLHAAIQDSIRTVLLIFVVTVTIDLGLIRLGLLPALMVMGAAFLSVPGILFGNLNYLMQSLNSMASERGKGYWEMVRITTLPPKVILDAKFAAIQVRCCHVLLVEQTIRLCIFAGMFPALLGMQLTPRYWRSVTIHDVFFAIQAVFIGALYFLEAGWRMRTVVAIGVAVSARFQIATMNYLAGSLVFLGFHLVLFLFLIPTWLISTSVSFAYLSVMSSPPSLHTLAFILFPALPFGLLYILYTVTQKLAYRTALRHAFRDME
jgi:hypothetical protein